MEAHLRQIGATNPAINAIVTLVADGALTQARLADERQARRRPGSGPLFGSPIFRDYVPPVSSLLVERLQGAGSQTFNPIVGATREWWRSVADLALMLQPIAGPDPRSPIAIEEPGSRFAASGSPGLPGWACRSSRASWRSPITSGPPSNR